MITSKLTLELEKEVMTRAGAGESCRAISAWLERDHGIRISHAAIAKRLAKTREERADVAKVIVRETLAPHLSSDLESLAKSKRRFETISTRLYKLSLGSGGTVRLEAIEMLVKVEDRLARVRETRLKFAGAGEDTAKCDGVQLPADRAERAAVLRALAEKESEGT